MVYHCTKAVCALYHYDWQEVIGFRQDSATRHMRHRRATCTGSLEADICEASFAASCVASYNLATSAILTGGDSRHMLGKFADPSDTGESLLPNW